MYGVPTDLDLTGFHGATLIQIALAEHNLYFHFQEAEAGPVRSILVEGGWEVRAADGELVDQVQEHATREYYRVHRLLSQSVVGSSVDAPRSFALRFTSGLQLRVFDDSEQYESFAIHPGDVFV